MPGTDDWLGLQHRLHQLRRGEPTLGLIALEFWLRKGCRTPDFFSDCEKALVSQGRSRITRSYSNVRQLEFGFSVESEPFGALQNR